jgi:hypothetical protein
MKVYAIYYFGDLIKIFSTREKALKYIREETLEDEEYGACLFMDDEEVE